ncbi:MAG: hypothetical protein Kapaf2KO_11170 [Candidatus Kapaibacteriales bacterium]
MKYISSFLFVAAIAFFMQSCDIIEAPYEEIINVDTSQNTNSDTIFRTILLEEFTGYRCASCPQAADAMKDLKKVYPNTLELLTIHSGGFVAVRASDSNARDFQTAVADDIKDQYVVNVNPRIAVNRTTIDGEFAIPFGKMQDAIAPMLNQMATVGIKTDATLNGNVISVDTELAYQLDGGEDDYLVHYIVVDSIVALQYDARVSPNKVYDYVHTNVLVDGINGAFGIKVTPEGTPAKIAGETSEFNDTYTITGDKDWDRDQIYILTIVTDGAAGPIYQVNKTKVN